ncbi:MAG: hypothetical protein PF961_14725 [Planctomycetota bacterium]|jgi:hypothetical protein|nr:hypothetical protein [Planctomycetota bacterium]
MRRGSILIIVSGLGAVLLLLATTFLVHMRNDLSESEFTVQEAQARVMLYAACNYVTESSRLGYDRLVDNHSTPNLADDDWEVRESFGWTDIRGPKVPQAGHASASLGAHTIGPKDSSGNCLWENYGVWPGPGGVARNPMQRWVVPPYALIEREVYNPLQTPPPADWRTAASFPNRFPQPEMTTLTDYLQGDRQVAPASDGKSWFRVYRERAGDHDGNGRSWDNKPSYDTVDFTGHHGIFVVTCGAGGTFGYRDWAEVTALGDTAVFGSELEFDRIRAAERQLHFRIEYSAAVSSLDAVYDPQNAQEQTWMWGDRWDKMPANFEKGDGFELSGEKRGFNPLGTIAWIQRLEEEPPWW